MEVSVCLPVLNGARTIRLAIESVLNQSHRDLELLVWDDGSSDETAAIASEYPVRLFRSENFGVAKARNQMMREAKFDLIALIDHDDVWKPHKLEQQIPMFRHHEVVLAHANCNFVDGQGLAEVRKSQELPLDDPFAHILPDNKIITSSAVFRRSVLLTSGGFPHMPRCSDWQGWFELASQGNFVCDDDVLVEYLVRNDSLANAGLRFHQSQVEVLLGFVLPNRKKLFERMTPGDQKKYAGLARRSAGVALSSISSCEWKEGRKAEARRYALRAIVKAPRVFRVVTRAWRAFTK